MIDRNWEIDTWYKNFYNSVNVSAREGTLASRFIHRVLESTNPFEKDRRQEMEILEVGSNGLST